jgi:arginine N-succinyltransferase
VALHREVFCEEVVSELMPPLESDGRSMLWEALGRHFTGLTYQEADRLSRENKEFIRTLFPQDPIYASVLPDSAQALIGQVGPSSKAVEKLLRRIGFDYAQRIDPFDGGPHFHARTDDITLVRQLRPARLAAGAATDAPLRPVLVARQRATAPYVLAMRALAPAPQQANDGTLALPADVAHQLQLVPGDELAYLLLHIVP